MDNMDIYSKVRAVPQDAQKQIKGGRLKGMTDINPMWRIKALTELFGPCGNGWKALIMRTWTESGANGEVAAFVQIDLYVRFEGEWSDPIQGIGGSMLVTKEQSGLRTNDECYKMAYTDALSVACKALGFGADVYWDKDKSKYDQPESKPLRCRVCGKGVTPDFAAKSIAANGAIYCSGTCKNKDIVQ